MKPSRWLVRPSLRKPSLKSRRQSLRRPLPKTEDGAREDRHGKAEAGGKTGAETRCAAPALYGSGDGSASPVPVSSAVPRLQGQKKLTSEGVFPQTAVWASRDPRRGPAQESVEVRKVFRSLCGELLGYGKL